MKILARLARPLSYGAALLALANAVFATWSIVAVNTKTGEVCVSSATCLANFDLQRYLPVVVVGKGGGAAQSAIDASGANRKIIWDGLIAGASPALILQNLAGTDPQHQSRQYGIVDMHNPPITFTGSGAGIAKFGVAGADGEILYAIQGNVLTGNAVITAAEQAFLAHQGDLGHKVILGMEAARLLGGDGRCSCNPSAPTSCGVPPPNFVFSDYTCFFIHSRIGDTDGVCNGSIGCANGSYFLDLKVIGNSSSPKDPVLIMEEQYDTWRATMVDRPDGVYSILKPGAHSVPADGITSAPVELELYDINGTAIQHGGATIQLTNISGAPAVTTPSAVVDHGNGKYSFTLQAGTQTGQDIWRIKASDGVANATLVPDVPMRVDPVFDLHCGFDQVAAFQDVLVPFTINVGSVFSHHRYLLLASASGTAPGFVFEGAALPLNPDKFIRITVTQAGSSLLPNSIGVLDSNGYGHGGFHALPQYLSYLVGGRLDWSAYLYGQFPVATGNAGFDIIP
jgi:uncharacterized protein DUF1028/invasin-like protein